MLRWSLLGCVVCAVSVGCASGSGVPESEHVDEVDQGLTLGTDDPVGLSFFFVDGQMAPMTLMGNTRRYLQEIDITASVTTSTDQGIAPLAASGELASLDWTGATQVEEEWFGAADGTFTRERYYRHARWMEQPSAFLLVAENARGTAVGSPLLAFAGEDDAQSPLDDDFTRRFTARQIATGCPAVGDCTGASFKAEGLVQLRDALKPEAEAAHIPASAARLKLYWTQQIAQPRVVAVSHVKRHDSPFAYGFQVSLDPASTPANGRFYQRGESVSFRVTFRDGEGNRLHPVGSLPSYGEFLSGQVASGLRYLDIGLQTRLYYALKHRESNLLAVLSGPTDKLTTAKTVVDPAALFAPQVPFATTPIDGYTALGVTIPPAAIIFGGAQDPTLWALPTSDLVTFTIPADADPGTYVLAIKARRQFDGEALNRGATVDLQVGQAAPTTFVAKTSCGGCHSSDTTRFDRILHGIGDRRACFGCHSSLGVEPDNVIDVRVHTIHDRSDRFPADVHDCSTCHVTPPAGPARGLL